MVAFQLIVGGNALVPLLHPVFMFGLSQRGVPNKIRILLYTPLHWLLLSAAAWLAALELLWGPFRWRKTEHGLDDASRRERATKSLLELERLVSGLIKRGELAQIQD